MDWKLIGMFDEVEKVREGKYLRLITLLGRMEMGIWEKGQRGVKNDGIFNLGYIYINADISIAGYFKTRVLKEKERRCSVDIFDTRYLRRTQELSVT